MVLTKSSWFPLFLCHFGKSLNDDRFFVKKHNVFIFALTELLNKIVNYG